MANRKPLIDEDGEVREITAEDVALFKPFSALPAAELKLLLKLRKRGPRTWQKVCAPPAAAGRAARMKRSGHGWQGRLRLTLEYSLP